MDPAILRRVLVTDRRRVADSDPVRAIARGARRGGATCILLREKDVDDDALVALVRNLCERTGLPLLLAHRADLVRRSGAAGVHLGWTSVSVGKAREILGPGALVGVSVHDVDEGMGKARAGADYLVLGPILPTPKDHEHVAPLGFGALGELARSARVPVVGIGGLGPEHEGAVRAAGGAGFAAIRAFLEA